MHEVYPGIKELAVGPFLIHYAVPRAFDPARRYNMTIWPAGAQDGGHILQGNKVANVVWDQWDQVRIISFHSGAGEDELLQLLIGAPNVDFLPRR